MQRFVFALIVGLFATQVAASAGAETCVWRGTAPFCAGSCEPGERGLEQTATPPVGDACLTGTKILCCRPDLVASDPTASNQLDRPGADYSNFDLTNTSASYRDCRQACALDARCRAYTFVNAGVQGAHPRCWLKTSVPAPRTSKCCVSGVLPPPEPATDRPGGDYRTIDMRTANEADCRLDCVADSKCKAYTYVKPGVQAPQARCWLKSSVPAPRANGCCASGVIR